MKLNWSCCEHVASYIKGKKLSDFFFSVKYNFCKKYNIIHHAIFSLKLALMNIELISYTFFDWGGQLL